jgi:hypothetical protein
VEYVITQDLSSGRVHKRISTSSGYLTHEADNLDDAGEFRVITDEEFAVLPPEAICKRCWPEQTPE